MKREHYRPFNPEQAKSGAPYGHQNDEFEVKIYEYFVGYCVGAYKPYGSRWVGVDFDYENDYLVMIPIATCQGKPVFVGDKLYDENGDKFQADMNCLNVIPRCTWEPARAQIRTSYSGEELAEIWSGALGDGHDSYVYVANTAIQRAIEDGDVVPTSAVKAIYVFSMSLGEEGKFLAENILQAVGPAKAVILDNK